MTYGLKFNFNVRYRNGDDPRVQTRTVDTQTYQYDKLSSIYALAEAHAKVLADSYQLTVYAKSYSAVHMVVEKPISSQTEPEPPNPDCPECQGTGLVEEVMRPCVFCRNYSDVSYNPMPRSK